MSSSLDYSLNALKQFLRAKIARLNQHEFSEFYDMPVLFKEKLRDLLLSSGGETEESKAEDLVKKWLDYKTKKSSLSAKDLTRMCSIPEILADDEFIQLLLTGKVNVSALRTQRSLLLAYMRKFRVLSMNRELSDFLLKNLHDLFVTAELKAEYFIGQNAPDNLATKLLEDKEYRQISQIFDKLRLEPSFSEFYAELLKNLAKQLIKKILELNRGDINFLVHDIIWNDSLALEARSELTTYLIKAVNGKPSQVELVRDSILDLDKLGDPRIHYDKWIYYSLPEARQIFVSWLSERDLKFFFDFVFANTEDIHNRKNFWMLYIDQVVDSRVFIAESLAVSRKRDIPNNFDYGIVRGGKVSAFVMRFTQIVAVEFSEYGNACWLYRPHDFSKVLDDLRTTNIQSGTLKQSQLKLEYIGHSANWQERLMKRLEHFGLRPNYRAF
ncbi:MAG: EH signature domain-containing protein [Deltaproteobacteria bacterium]|nr:EH signature domain-containing protein [Deltaproteobacteria bacterium]